jgi:hypothetical protein
MRPIVWIALFLAVGAAAVYLLRVPPEDPDSILEESEIDAMLADEMARMLATPICPECGAFGYKEMRAPLTYRCQVCGTAYTGRED